MLFRTEDLGVGQRFYYGLSHYEVTEKSIDHKPVKAKRVGNLLRWRIGEVCFFDPKSMCFVTELTTLN
jgi:hypothetical protein